ncbi:MAG: glycosyltransferase family 9 protein [Candidatus Omnitrophota bacterium]
MRKKSASFLVINPFGIGDVLFSTPLIRNLRENFPAAEIYYLCNRRTAPILKQHTLLKKVFVYERDDFVKARKQSFRAWLKKFCGFIGEIRAERIDAVIDLSLNTQYGFFAWLAGIPRRYGLDYKNRCRFLNKKIAIGGYSDKHVADYYLDVLKLLDIEPKICGLEIYTDIASNDRAETFLKQKGISEKNCIIGIAPCGGSAFGKDAYIKRWPADKYSALIDGLINEFKAKIFIFAGPEEKEDVAGILQAVRLKSDVYEFTGSSLAQTAALVDKCGLFIGNDTGPLRFADALNKKIVALFGPVDEKVYGPYPYEQGRTVVIKKDMACRPCYRKFRLPPCPYNKKCLEDITVEEVLQAVRKLRGQEKNFSV